MKGWTGFAEWLGFHQKRCSHCGSPYFPGELKADFVSLRFCPGCQPDFAPYCGPACRLCGAPDVMLDDAGLCSQCRRTKPLWDGLGYYGLYEGNLRDLVLRLKFDGELQLLRPFADFLLQACIGLPAPDAIVAVPQFPAALRKRGFNQAHELGRALARLTGFHLNHSLLWRTRPSVPQESLGAQERRQNLVGAFEASLLVRERVIWVIDDVMTTGSTFAEAARALRSAGAKRVYALCVARTPFSEK